MNWCFYSYRFSLLTDLKIISMSFLLFFNIIYFFPNHATSILIPIIHRNLVTNVLLNRCLLRYRTVYAVRDERSFLGHTNDRWTCRPSIGSTCCLPVGGIVLGTYIHLYTFLYACTYVSVPLRYYAVVLRRNRSDGNSERIFLCPGFCPVPGFCPRFSKICDVAISKNPGHFYRIK